ncbi:hypothetical protein C8R45DRAFT_1147721 [Mycena sanguinolenta]|nr:hypothetical protein C8R45DRAFT_1147721 [Mycena sanguinolenta]
MILAPVKRFLPGFLSLREPQARIQVVLRTRRLHSPLHPIMPAPIDLSTFHPDEFLDHYPASSSEKIRNQRKGYVSSCGICLKNDTDLGRPLRRCGKCRLMSYCPKETQRWPEHKETCGKEDVPKFIPKLVRTLFANHLLSLHLQNHASPSPSTSPNAGAAMTCSSPDWTSPSSLPP